MTGIIVKSRNCGNLNLKNVKISIAEVTGERQLGEVRNISLRVKITGSSW